MEKWSTLQIVKTIYSQNQNPDSLKIWAQNKNIDHLKSACISTILTWKTNGFGLALKEWT
jgi:hypothetical protein